MPGTLDRTDPGLQPQRTELAWNRTSIAILANGLLVAGKGLLSPNHSPSPVRTVLIGVAIIAAAGVYLIGRRRCRRLADTAVPLEVSARRCVVVTAALVVMTVLTLVTAATLA